MHPRNFALISGAILLIMGVFALIPALSSYPNDLPPLWIERSYGVFLNLIPMNIVNKIALILTGALGIAAATAKYNSLPMSIWYSRFVFFSMAVLTVMGLFPQTDTFFGYWPLFQANIIVYGLMAALGAYFGYALTSRVPDSGPAKTDFRSPLSGTR